MSQDNLSSSERWLAALAHAGILIPSFGFVVPLIVWVTQREKSAFARFQALQALAYQLLLAVVWVVLFGLAAVLVIVLSLSMLGVAAVVETQAPLALLTVAQIIIFSSPFCLIGLTALLGIIAAIACLGGNNFRYPLLGSRLERFLSRTSANPEVGHA